MKLVNHGHVISCRAALHFTFQRVLVADSNAGGWLGKADLRGPPEITPLVILARQDRPGQAQNWPPSGGFHSKVRDASIQGAFACSKSADRQFTKTHTCSLATPLVVGVSPGGRGTPAAVPPLFFTGLEMKT